MGVMIVAGQDARLRGCLADGLLMNEVRGEAGGQGGLLWGVSAAMDGAGADLAPLRMVVYLAAQCVRHQLVAVADAEHRHLLLECVADPLRCLLTPRL